MRISKYDLCSECRKLRVRMNNGSLSDTVEEMLESKGYDGMGYIMINHMILSWLEEDGGCSRCISKVRSAT